MSVIVNLFKFRIFQNFADVATGFLNFKDYESIFCCLPFFLLCMTVYTNSNTDVLNICVIHEHEISYT